MHFHNKHITVMGLGTLGGGVGTVRYLCKHGAKVTATDTKQPEELEDAIESLSDCMVVYKLGGHDARDFENKDMIIRNPAVPVDSKYLQIARDHSIPIEMAESLFLKLSPTKNIIGVTGTRGKSTTSAMIDQILLTAGKDSHLAGNQKGTSTLELLDSINHDSYVVLELSSWQTESFGWHRINPSISVVTNIYPDHLNRYASMEEYVQSKANVFLYQSEKDHLILNNDNEQTKLFACEARSKVHWFSAQSLPDYIKLKLKGTHNRENAACSYVTAAVLEIANDYIADALRKFTGLTGRLEVLGTIDGVIVVNDTTSTTPIAAVKALESYPQKRIIHIVGGNTKNLPIEQLISTISDRAKALVYLEGNGTEKVQSDLKQSNILSAGPYTNLSDALNTARGFADLGDVILFSPAFTSFAHFKNEFDRGEAFSYAFAQAKSSHQS